MTFQDHGSIVLMMLDDADVRVHRESHESDQEGGVRIRNLWSGVVHGRSRSSLVYTIPNTHESYLKVSDEVRIHVGKQFKKTDQISVRECAPKVVPSRSWIEIGTTPPVLLFNSSLGVLGAISTIGFESAEWVILVSAEWWSADVT